MRNLVFFSGQSDKFLVPCDISTRFSQWKLLCIGKIVYSMTEDTILEVEADAEVDYDAPSTCNKAQRQW